jgi:diaminohydroxyphosphoribosylaminopyrimidine deaminase/5-amino-6-(5-phosphoribosylamino)uracil reductase
MLMNPFSIQSDIKFMKIAQMLSWRGKGLTEPNPMVGAVAVKNNRIVGSGYHAACGQMHAEVMALKNLNEPDCTLYVTLEPCSHFGKTPPCADMILKKKIKRVVVAMIDPNPLVNGQGIEKLQDQGVNVEVGLTASFSKKINKHYLTFITQKRPFITLKAGISLDGKLTDKQGSSQWITNQTLRSLAHHYRAQHMAILCGANTIRQDNPQLTIRHPEWQNKLFYRIVLDTQNTLAKDRCVFNQSGNSPLIIFSSDSAANRVKKTDNHYFVSADDNGLNLNEIMAVLYRLSISSVLVEGGGKLHNSFLQKKMFDEMILFTEEQCLGGKTSVELFNDGVMLKDSVRLYSTELFKLDHGFIIRGYRTCLPE